MVDPKDILKKISQKQSAIGVIGLGYVGLPLAISFSKKYKVIGFDINIEKIQLLQDRVDPTGEILDIRDLSSSNFSVTFDPNQLSGCDIFVVAVPTPVDKGNKPDLTPLFNACETLGRVIKSSKNVIYACFESTVYPGCTEDDCVPIIEKFSGKKLGEGFFIGYSPERINPGDKEHRFESITKVVSGCCFESRELFAALYGSVITAGIYQANSIKVAEAAKVIENTQRDLNIALVNELAIIFSRLGIDTQDVLKTAGTKWNFLNFQPGLVGGHCIGVDPYYLTYKAETTGYRPKVILAGRAVNDEMGAFVAQEAVKRALRYPPKFVQSYQALVLGFTFKENVPDIRNTKVIDIVNALESYNISVDIVDPIGSKKDALHEYGVEIGRMPPKALAKYDLVVLAVPHIETMTWLLDELLNLEIGLKTPITLIDVKGVLKGTDVLELGRKIDYWRL